MPRLSGVHYVPVQVSTIFRLYIRLKGPCRRWLLGGEGGGGEVDESSCRSALGDRRRIAEVAELGRERADQVGGPKQYAGISNARPDRDHLVFE